MVIMSPYRAKLSKLYCIVERRKKKLLAADQAICDEAGRQILALAEIDGFVSQVKPLRPAPFEGCKTVEHMLRRMRPQLGKEKTV